MITSLHLIPWQSAAFQHQLIADSTESLSLIISTQHAWKYTINVQTDNLNYECTLDLDKYMDMSSIWKFPSLFTSFSDQNFTSSWWYMICWYLLLICMATLGHIHSDIPKDVIPSWIRLFTVIYFNLVHCYLTFLYTGLHLCLHQWSNLTAPALP